MKRLRTGALHGEVESESVLLNLLLRNFLHYNLFEQAEKLISKSSFPEQANNNEWARFLYYTGRIKAIQLEYSDAQKTITNENGFARFNTYRKKIKIVQKVKSLQLLQLLQYT